MNTKYIATVALIVGMAGTAFGHEPRQGWHHNFATAIREAETANLPLLLHFHAAWCGPCQQMERSVLNTPDVLRQLGTVVIGAKIDADREPDVAQRFGVPAYPCDVLIAPNGKVLLQTSGYAQATEYVQRIQTAASSFAPRAMLAKSTRPSRADASPGLKGFSPVSIVCGREWRKGLPELAWEYDGIVYHLADAEELELFKADPASYAPQFRGRDPICLVTDNEEQSGDIHFAAFFRNRLYLLSSSINRKRFIASPQLFENAPHAELIHGVARAGD